VSANPTGPLHAGHGRHIALGKAVANLLEWSGYKLTREYYYNDAGNQMENLARSVYARYRQLYEPDYPFPENGYVGDYVVSVAELVKKEYGNKLIGTPDDTLFKKAGEDWCFDSIKHTLQRLGIRHDVFYNETSLYESGKISKALEEFHKKGLSYEKDGAVWLKTSELLKDKKDAEDKVIVKSTGEPTYRMPDMAYHADKINRGFDKIVDIFGADHGDTYKEVLAGVEGLGYDVSKIKVIIHQMVTFVQDGKPVKMSKRADNVYYLDELLDDVGVDVAQFFFVMRSANTHLEFDVALAKEQSDKNPVFYLQYAHARISGILRNAKDIMPEFENENSNGFDKLNEADEIDLRRVLAGFPDVVENACLTLEPHKIITYLNSVAESYHRFYHNNRVIDTENKPLSYQRIKLCEAAKIVLKNGFDIIGISAPERM
jgi:arginyl-tRNA synthetase